MLKHQIDSINPSYRHQQSEKLSHVFGPVEFPLPKHGPRGPLTIRKTLTRHQLAPDDDQLPVQRVRTGDFKPRAADFPSKKTRRRVVADPLALYLDQALQSELLDRAQEFKLTKSLFLYRLAFQRLILKEPIVIKYLIELLEDIISKRIRLDAGCNLGLSETAKRKQVEPRLKPTLRWLKRTLQQLRNPNQEASPTVGDELTSNRRRVHSELIQRVELLLIRPQHFESAPFASPNASFLLSQYREICQTIVRSNLRLVVQFTRQVCGNSEAVLDMIQEGNRGLLHAVNKFDYRSGVRFSTYAMPWIKQAIFGALPNHHRNIRVPENFRAISRRVQNELQTLQRGTFEFRHRDSGQTIALIAESLKMSSFEVAGHLRMQRDTCSLDQPLGSGTGGSGTSASSLGDLLTDERNTPSDTIISQQQQAVRAVMTQALTPREREVIMLRFGFDDGKNRSFAEVGRQMGLTRQRVCQVEKHALAKLEKMSDRFFESEN